jgi:hypothetical protein
MSVSTDKFVTVEAGAFRTITQPIDCWFDPQPDITAFELARILPYLTSRHQGIYEADWQALGAATRHLKRNDRSAGQ